MSGRVRRWAAWAWLLPTLAVLVALLALFAVGPTGSGTSASRSLPATTYGPPGGRFVVSFGALPHEQRASAARPNGAALEHVSTSYVLYVAHLPGAYETVQVDLYPGLLTKAGLDRYVYRYVLAGMRATTLDGHPAWTMDEACHVGISIESCPGRLVYTVVVAPRAVYWLEALQVGESEAQRFMSSFRPVTS